MSPRDAVLVWPAGMPADVRARVRARVLAELAADRAGAARALDDGPLRPCDIYGNGTDKQRRTLRS